MDVCLQKKYPHKDPFLGLDLLLAVRRSLQRGQSLVENQQLYERYGRTFQTISFGSPIINTIEPENLKPMLATSFDNFGFGPVRRHMRELWGKGILSEDGEYWQHSRALIRPTFAKAQAHLEPLFKRYILDTSTEFLFGESVHSQASKVGDEGENERFIEAFEYASMNIGK
ncbi:hypothetical protein MMC14_007975 [Varicellaria rhodocarpa]|nr:hypothetical protein [Varicellaria rhodocarpa]